MVVEPLQADTLLVLTYRGNEGCSTADACGLTRRLARLMPVVTRLELELMPSVGALLRHLEALPHWPTILRTFNRTRHWRGFEFTRRNGHIYLDHARPRYVSCVRVPGWRDGDERTAHGRGGQRSPYECEGLREWGNSIFAPVIGPTGLNVLWQIHGLSRVLALLRSQQDLQTL